MRVFKPRLTRVMLLNAAVLSTVAALGFLSSPAEALR